MSKVFRGAIRYEADATEPQDGDSETADSPPSMSAMFIEQRAARVAERRTLTARLTGVGSRFADRMRAVLSPTDVPVSDDDDTDEDDLDLDDTADSPPPMSALFTKRRQR
jgi:hypothetical protein